MKIATPKKVHEEALAAYQHAVELDPEFALAWAGVRGTNIWHCNFATEGGLKSFDAHFERRARSDRSRLRNRARFAGRIVRPLNDPDKFRF